MAERASTESSVFARVLSGAIPGEVLLSTEDVFVLRDIAPQAPVHLLVIPKTERYRDVVELAADDPRLLAHMVEVARLAANAQGVTDFRLIFNTGPGAGQTVFHVHAHVLGVPARPRAGVHDAHSPSSDLGEGTMTAGMPEPTERNP